MNTETGTIVNFKRKKLKQELLENLDLLEDIHRAGNLRLGYSEMPTMIAATALGFIYFRDEDTLELPEKSREKYQDILTKVKLAEKARSPRWGIL